MEGQTQARGASVDHGREPCPDRILDDMGGAFGMGAVGGGLWHFFKGLKNSPSNARMRGGLEVRLSHLSQSENASSPPIRATLVQQLFVLVLSWLQALYTELLLVAVQAILPSDILHTQLL